MWRWDQGRLLYFQFDILRAVAQVLSRFDGVDITTCEDAFRSALEADTGMAFLPKHYTVKRNYSRVFQCALLANFVGEKLYITDMCRELCNKNSDIKTADDYLLTYIKKFRFPFPAFDGYNGHEQPVYPFCAIIKYLLSLQMRGLEAKVSLDDIFRYVIGNNCTGFENIAFYCGLQPTDYSCTDAERRQLREMVIFISQLSILQVYGGYLYLENISDDVQSELIMAFLEPERRIARMERIDEFYEMASLDRSRIRVPKFETFVVDPMDLEFMEGNRRRVEHFRVERSRLLRKYYQQVHPDAICCACNTDMGLRYPWTEFMIDIHHLLPLSSVVAISARGTSLADIVGLCPSCHRAIHMYYRKWLTTNGQNDFSSKQEAHDVYLQATKEIVR